MSSPPFSFFPEGARVSGCAGELLADMADRRAGMGRGCAAGDGGPPSSAAHPCPGALPQSSGSRGGEERRRGSGIGIWLGRWLAAARVLRAAERGRRGPGGDRRDVGERSGHWLPPPAAALPAALASPQRGGAAHRALLFLPGSLTNSMPFYAIIIDDITHSIPYILCCVLQSFTSFLLNQHWCNSIPWLRTPLAICHTWHH